MKRKLSTIICFILSFVCCLSLVACGGGGDNTNSSSMAPFSSNKGGYSSINEPNSDSDSDTDNPNSSLTAPEQSSQTENSSSENKPSAENSSSENKPSAENSSSETKPDTDKPVAKQTTKVDELVPVTLNLTTNSRYVTNVYNKPQIEANDKYVCTEIAVEAGERYVFSFAIQSAKSYGMILANANKSAVYQLFNGKNTFVEYNNIQILVPTDIKYIYVNTRNPKVLTAHKLVQTEKEITKVSNITANSLKLGSANCGKFEYTDGTTSATDYQKNWQTMLNAVNADVFMFEDVAENFATGITADSVINSGTNKLLKIAGLADCIRGSSKYEVETQTVIPLDSQIEGSSKVTARFYAVRFTFHINGKHLAVYGLHFVAESHISAEVQEDGTSLSQKLRQKQFQGLINDAKYYDESIFIGDFNAQKPEEYDIFKTNGYQTANCGEFGTFATLRDIPADNIIVSKGFKITNMGLLDTYKLNTDHKAFYADVAFKNN